MEELEYKKTLYNIINGIYILFGLLALSIILKYILNMPYLEMIYEFSIVIFFIILSFIRRKMKRRKKEWDSGTS